MSNEGKSRYSSHRWRNETRCRMGGREDYRVTYLMTLAQEQSRKLLMLCQRTWVIDFAHVFVLKQMGHLLIPNPHTPVVYSRQCGYTGVHSLFPNR